MKLVLKKSQLKNLTKDNAVLPDDATAKIAGAGARPTADAYCLSGKVNTCAPRCGRP
ncbi:hypothetical protein JK628_01375 [Shewanella sp. KX20019]|uniref:hypothetical protein n=1 Tax=Shewanella sp. KX20019 TaxID=2803864 RepID=UPI00192614E3|nr:hypothetical protein [Shewanella sp. KX20019]QQX80561.1 hypothetical protein JK628_01375 [Shewanella sp. KX20019]